MVQREYLVYGLIDPRSPETVKYVGATSKSLKTRLSGHIGSCRKKITESQKWVASLLDAGVKPEIIQLQECSEAEAAEMEGKWIGFFRPCKNTNLSGWVAGNFTLGQRLKNWRLEYPQKQAALALGVSLSTYRNWEYEDSIPSILAMKQIDSCLSTPLLEHLQKLGIEVTPLPPKPELWRETARKWRGSRTIKEAAVLIGVGVQSIKAWEYGMCWASNEKRRAEILKRMEATREPAAA